MVVDIVLPAMLSLILVREACVVALNGQYRDRRERIPVTGSAYQLC